jgi:hypothetical protein
MRTTQATAQASRPYYAQVSGILAAAFTLSLGYTIGTSIAGEPYSTISPSDPATWVVYAVGFVLVAQVRLDKAWTWGVVLAAVTAFIGVGLFYYPTLFVPAAQHPLGWVKNDVYMALLFLTAFLCVQRLRLVAPMPGE